MTNGDGGDDPHNEHYDNEDSVQAQVLLGVATPTANNDGSRRKADGKDNAEVGNDEEGLFMGGSHKEHSGSDEDNSSNGEDDTPPQNVVHNGHI